MSTMPPQKDEPDDMDADYRRWSSNDTSRPSDSVRTAVLAHAARLAAERQTSLQPSKSRRRPYRWAAPVFGGLAAATLVGFLVIPRFIDSGQQADKAANSPIAPDAPLAMTREAAPTVSPPAVAERFESKPAENASNPAKSRAKRVSPVPPTPSVRALDEIVVTESLANRSRQESAPNIVAGRAADSASAAASPSASAADFSPRAGLTATIAGYVDPGAALRRSASLGDLPGVSALLGGKIDIESRDAAGRTALMLAASSGRTDIVTALLAHGADPNAADSYGDTPLHAASAGNYSEIVNALKRAGAH